MAIITRFCRFLSPDWGPKGNPWSPALGLKTHRLSQSAAPSGQLPPRQQCAQVLGRRLTPVPLIPLVREGGLANCQTWFIIGTATLAIP